MQFIRSTAFNIIMFGSGALFSLWGVFARRVRPGGALIQARLWGRVCLWALRVCCGITVKAEGLELLPEGGCVIAAQHQSALDILIWLALVPRPAFVFKRELKRIPLFGGLLEPSGMIAVDRGGGGVALREMLTGAAAAMAAGRQVVIFPEGTRVAHGVRGQIRNGVVALAQTARVPVLPAITNSGKHWGRKAYGKTPGTVYVMVQPAFPASVGRDEIIRQLEELYYRDLPART